MRQLNGMRRWGGLCLAMGLVTCVALADGPKDKSSIKAKDAETKAKGDTSAQTIQAKAAGVNKKVAPKRKLLAARKPGAEKAPLTSASAGMIEAPASETLGGVATTSAYFAGFETGEGFSPGDLDSQAGWTENGPGAYSITTANPATGLQHVRCASLYAPTGDFPLTLAFSPTLPSKGVGDTQMSINFNIGATGGADYGIIAQAPDESEDVTFFVRFYWSDADGDSIPGDIMTLEPDGSGGYEWTPTGAEYTPDTYQNFQVVIDADTMTIEYLLDGAPIATGAVVGAAAIQQIILCDDQYQSGEAGDFDNLQIGDTTETHACCLGGGPSGCQELSIEDCAGLGGTTLIDVACGSIAACTTGACCEAGTCSNVSWNASCDDYYGDGSSCDTITCAPANDACEDQIEAFDGTVAYTTAGATTDGPPSETCDEYSDDQVNQDIWYYYTATCTGYASVNLCDSLFDTKLAVYEGCTCPVTETRILDCDDEACGTAGDGVPSAVEVPVVSGTCYLIRVGGYGSATGEGVLEIACEQPTCGNGTNEAGEDCDDGNLIDGDGCSDDCHYEGACCVGLDCYELYTEVECDTAGGLWAGPDSECKCVSCPFCGDGVVNLDSEECDDGNTVDDDVCANDCTYNPVANDDCADKITISDGSFVFNTLGATTDGFEDEGCGFEVGDNQIYNDIWYNYNAAVTGQITIDLSNSGFDTRMSVYEGCTCPPTSADLILCDDDGGAGLTSMAVFGGTAGTCYKVRIGGYTDTSAGAGEGAIYVCGNGTVEPGEECEPPGTASCDATCQRIAVCGDGFVDGDEECDDGNVSSGDGCDSGCYWEIPANDDCANYIAAVDGTNAFTTNGATLDGPDEPDCLGDDGVIDHDIWYSYTPAIDGVLTIDTCGTADFDTRIAVYDSTTCPATGLVTCNDDFCGLQSYVSFNATGGNTYLIRIGGYVDSMGEGSFQLELCDYTCDAGTPTDTEHDCADGVGGFTETNDGCSEDTTTPDFTTLNVGDAICGTGGTYNDGTEDLRDVDWYLVHLDTEMDLTITLEGDFWMELAGYEIDLGDAAPCDTLSMIMSDSVAVEPCYAYELSGCLPAGDYVFVVTAYLQTECGSQYTISAAGDVCATGACCVPDGSCSEISVNDCADGDGIFYGEDTTCADEEVDCPPGQLCVAKNEEKCQRPDQGGHGIDDTLAATSDREAGITVAEDFTPTENDSITNICWWGMYHDFGSSDECADDWPDHFIITYYLANGANGAPGTVLASFEQGVDLVVTKQGTTLPLDGHFEYEYSATHDPVAVEGGLCYWVEISNALNCTCAWLWETAGPGNERALQDADEDGYQFPDDEIFYDLAMCLSLTTADLGDLAGCVFPPDNDLCDNAIIVTDGTIPFENINAETDGPPHGDCANEGSQPGNDCCTGEIGDGPGCDNFDCEFIICSLLEDTYCCTDDWDDTCAEEAVALCSECGGAVDLFMADVWYLYQATCDGVLTVETCETEVDTKVAVYDSIICPMTQDDLTGCNDDSEDCVPAGVGSMVQVPVTTGELFTIRVGGWGGLEGTGTLSISCDVAEPTGSCCNEADWSCVDDVTEAECAYTWTEAGTCAVDCVEPPTGACCNEADWTCVDDVTEAECAFSWSEGAECFVDDFCVPGGDVPCVEDLDCVLHYNDACGWDKCDTGTGFCETPVARIYGDICGPNFAAPPNGAINTTDVLCTLSAFGVGNLGNCPNADIAIATSGQCPAGNGVVNLTDILKVLDAFGVPSPGALFMCDCVENPY